MHSMLIVAVCAHKVFNCKLAVACHTARQQNNFVVVASVVSVACAAAIKLNSARKSKQTRQGVQRGKGGNNWQYSITNLHVFFFFPHTGGKDDDGDDSLKNGSGGGGGGGGNSGDSHLSLSLSKKQRKARTAFTDHQLQTLEKSFERQKYLSVQDRMELANKLELSDCQVKTWYQNRR